MNRKDSDQLLRLALRGNALFSAVSGLVLAAGSYAIAPRLGVEPSWIVLAVGIGLLPFAFDLFVNSARLRIDHGRVKTAIAADIAWVAGSVAVVVIDPTGLTTAGYVTIVVVAAVVADFALLQWIGFRRANTDCTGVTGEGATPMLTQ